MSGPAATVAPTPAQTSSEFVEVDDVENDGVEEEGRVHSVWKMLCAS